VVSDHESLALERVSGFRVCVKDRSVAMAASNPTIKDVGVEAVSIKWTSNLTLLIELLTYPLLETVAASASDHPLTMLEVLSLTHSS